MITSFLIFFSNLNIIGQTETKAITEKFFSIYSQDPIKAVDYAFSTNKWFDRKQDDVANLKNKLQNLIELCGDYYGYELLTEKSIGTSLIVKSFLIKYEREPVRFTFSFYKANDSWMVNNFSFDEGVADELEEAAKVYRLGEIYE